MVRNGYVTMVKMTDYLCSKADRDYKIKKERDAKHEVEFYLNHTLDKRARKRVIKRLLREM